jgi:hypothetical protein
MTEYPTTLIQNNLHMFWAYGDLSKVERICTSSFLKNGYTLHLWTYGQISNAPIGAIIRDAREVIPENRVFLNREGSYASFADLFRYKVLNELGGIYADTDVVAMTPFANLQKTPFLVTERRPNSGGVQINNNVIFNPTPTLGNIIDLAYAISNRFPPQKIRWGEIGPKLLTALVQLQREHDFEIKEPNFANPINWVECPLVLLKPEYQLPPNVSFIHFYNETWRKAGIDKNSPFPEGCLMSTFEKMYLAS